MKGRKKRPIDMAAHDADGLTPLNLAVKSGNDMVVKAILQNSRDPDEVCVARERNF